MVTLTIHSNYAYVCDATNSAAMLHGFCKFLERRKMLDSSENSWSKLNASKETLSNLMMNIKTVI